MMFKCPECGCRLELVLCPFCGSWDFYGKADMHSTLRQIRQVKVLRARFI